MLEKCDLSTYASLAQARGVQLAKTEASDGEAVQASCLSFYVATSGPDPLTPVRVERISPADARALGDAFQGLRCRHFMGFVGFFNRAYREHDYLWGRLNGAERVVDLLASAAGDAIGDPLALKRELFQAIVDRERRRLYRCDRELDRVEAALRD